MPKNILVTEDYLKKTLNEFKVEFKDELKSNLLEIKEGIISEIKSMREEFDAHQYFHIRINDELSQHDERLSKIETAKN